MTYGKDGEQRAAIAQKASDAYALARQLDERLRAVVARLDDAEARLARAESQQAAAPTARRKAA